MLPDLLAEKCRVSLQFALFGHRRQGGEDEPKFWQWSQRFKKHLLNNHDKCLPMARDARGSLDACIFIAKDSPKIVQTTGEK